MLTTLMVDDEPLAHQVILHHLQKHQDIKVVGQCFNATQALSWLAGHQIDLLLLDINMPALSGIDMLKVLRNRPQVIIVSAYQEYAIQGFDLDVRDYVLKPVSAERLAQALDKVRCKIQVPSMPTPKHIVLKVNREKRKFTLDDISLFEAYGNYVKVWQGEQMALASSTLKQCLQQLPQQQFVQIHKSFVVNKQKIIAVDNESIRLGDNRIIKVGKLFKSVLSNLI